MDASALSLLRALRLATGNPWVASDFGGLGGAGGVDEEEDGRSTISFTIMMELAKRVLCRCA